MSLRARVGLLKVVVLSTFLLAACGTSGGGASGAAISTNGENLAFDKTTLSAGANQVITFKNGSASLQHDFVVVKGGDAAAQAVDDAAASASPSYIPSDPNIVGSIQPLNGGASGTLTVNFPAGTYTYLCTIPGHYGAGMKGTLTVQ